MFEKLGVELTDDHANSALVMGHVNTLKWLCEKRSLFPNSEPCLEAALRMGHTDAIKWIAERLSLVKNTPYDWRTGPAKEKQLGSFPWRDKTMAHVVNHTGLLSRLCRQYGCRVDERTAVNAAAVGAIDTLKWLHTNPYGCELPIFFTQFIEAIRNGQLESLDFLCRHCPRGHPTRVNLNLLSWVFTSCNAAFLMERPVRGDRLAVVKRLLADGERPMVDDYDTALLYGDVDILIALHTARPISGSLLDHLRGVIQEFKVPQTPPYEPLWVWLASEFDIQKPVLLDL
jgi:hypothetical protein